jgi:hypothetical protein
VRKIFILATNCTHNFLCKRYVHITYEKRKKLNEEKERKVKKENRWGPRTWESAGPSLSVGRSTGRSGRPVARLVFGGKEDCVGGMGARAAGGGGEQQPSGMLAGGRGSRTAYAKERWWMDRRSHCSSRWKMCHRRQGGAVAPGQPTEGGGKGSGHCGARGGRRRSNVESCRGGVVDLPLSMLAPTSFLAALHT